MKTAEKRINFFSAVFGKWKNVEKKLKKISAVFGKVTMDVLFMEQHVNLISLCWILFRV